MRRAFFAGLFLMATLLTGQTVDDVFRAIRAGDLETLRKLPLNVKDRLDNTPLHYAALYGNVETFRFLVEHGADVTARNKSEATPLLYGAYNFEKARLLVEKGSDVNVHSAKGKTPLMIAASTHGNAETVRYLLAKGADVKAVDAKGADALQVAAYKGDAAMIRMLLDKGADAKRMDRAGETALFNAFGVTDPERVQMLMDAGSDVHVFNTFAGRVKNGPITLVHQTPLIVASPDAGPSTIKALLRAGAPPNDADGRKITPLMLAVATDEPKLDTIKQLIDGGADVNAKDQNGDSVYRWALKNKNPDVLAALKTAGASRDVLPPAPAPVDSHRTPKEAVAKSTALLATAGATFFVEGGGCVGCHHQPINARAYAALHQSGQNPDERLRRGFLDSMTAVRPGLLSGLPLLTASGGDFDELLSQTQALADLGEPASPLTDAMIHYLAARQQPSGAWDNMGGPRPPMQSSSISRTAYAIRALKTYGWPARRAEFDERIGRARAWLLAARPVTRYEEADRIMGLKAAGVANSDLEQSARALIAEQRPDGGWSQTAYADSDAYATGLVLSTLCQQGFLKPSDPAYTRGVAYLLKTQFADGSWYVRSRAPKLQPYFQSAFPFDHDQWISNAATALAVMALAPALQ